MKKSLLISGALLLGAAFAVSTYAVLSTPQFAAAEFDDTDSLVEYTATIKASDPAEGQIFSTSDPVSKIMLQFMDNGELGLSFSRSADLNITVKKDGTVLYTIPSTDRAALTDDSRYPNRMYINLPQPLNTEGNYTIEIPQGLVLAAEADEESHTDGDGNSYSNIHVKYYNPDLSLSFSIDNSKATVISPKPGDVMPGGLDEITITYPEGTVLQYNESIESEVTLNLYDSTIVEGPRDTELTTYKVSIEGNVVTLTANNPDAITVLTKDSSFPEKIYDRISIPNGKWWVNNSLVPATILSPYWVVSMSASMIEVSPSLNTAEPIANTDLSEINLTFPSRVKIVNTGNYAFRLTSNTSTVASSNEAKIVNYRYKSLSADGRTMTVVPSDAMAEYNLPALLKSKCSFQIMANVISDAAGNKNSSITLNDFNIAGTQDVVLNYSATAGNTAPVTDKSLAAAGQKYVGAQFFYKVLPGDESKLITITLNGEVVKSWKPSEVSSNTSKQTAFAATGNQWAYMLMLDDYQEVFSGYGTYVINYPEGAFVAATNPQAKSQEVSFTIKNIDPNSVPVPTFGEGAPVLWNDNRDFPNIESVDKVVITYPAGCTVARNDASKAPAYGNYRLAKATATTNPYQTIANTIVKYDGNVVTINFGSPLYEAMGPLYCYCYKIPADMYTITDANGTVYNNPDIRLYWTNKEAQKPELGIAYDEGPDSKVGIFEQLPELTTDNVASVLNALSLYSKQPFYTATSQTALPYLVNAATGEKVAGVTYTKTKDSDFTGPIGGRIYLFKSTYDFMNLPAGAYKLIVPPGTVQYRSGTLAVDDVNNTASGFANEQEWEYPFVVSLGTLPETTPEPTFTVATAGIEQAVTNHPEYNSTMIELASEDSEVTSTTLTFTVDPALGYSMIYISGPADFDGPSYVRRNEASDWTAVPADLKANNTITVPKDGVSYLYTVKYGAHGLVNNDNWGVTVKFSDKLYVGVDMLTEGETAEYYTLQGVRVANPGAGIFVKVVNGKATKVIRK